MTAWPLDNTEYTAEAIGAWSGTRTRGVFSAEDCFAVTATGGFGIKVSPGLAWLKIAEYWGAAVLEKSETDFTVNVGSGLLARYVAVVLQYDKTANDVQLVLRYGEYGSPAVKPQPVRDTYYDEIILASILQPAAAVEITQADITDERLNEDLCGLMRDGVTGIPTAQLFAQVRDQLDRQQDVFSAWFEHIKGQLDEDPAGHLQLQLDELAADVQIFEVVLTADGWAEGDTGVWTQTVDCPDMLPSYDTEAPETPSTGNKETDTARKEALDVLCEAGNSGETLDGAFKWTCYGSHPEVDLPLRLRASVLGTKQATQAAWVSAQQAAESQAAASESETAAASSANAAAESAESAAAAADRAQKISQGAVGHYDTPENLRAKHPAGEVGQWAIVGVPFVVWDWDPELEDWKNTEKIIDFIGTGDCYTKDETDAKIDDAKGTVFSIAVPASGWQGDSPPYTNTVQVEGVTADTILTCVQLAPADVGNEDAEQASQQWNELDTQDGAVEFTAAGTKPVDDFTILARAILSEDLKGGEAE